MITHIGLRFLMPFLFILILSSFGGCRSDTSTSELKGVVPTDTYYVSGLHGQKSFGLLTFSDSPYGTLVDGSFRNLPAGTTAVALTPSCQALSDQLRQSPHVDLPFLGELTTSNGVGEIHILVPTASDQPVKEQLASRQSLVLANEYLGHRTVVACGDRTSVTVGEAASSAGNQRATF